jgi:HAD superfamily hydrolase (TIGR01509 family)
VAKAYLFDFDGTLVDSMPFWSEKMLNILRQTGVSYPADIIKILTPLGDKGSAVYFRDVLGVKLSEEEMYARMDSYALPKYRDEILLKPGVEAFLRKCKEEGITLHVLTASPHKMLDPCLRRNGVYDLFDHVWSCEDFGTTKSDPEIYRRAAEKIGLDVADVVFFDDNLLAVQTAAQAGMKTVGVYDPTGEDFVDALTQTADQYIRSFEELM